MKPTKGYYSLIQYCPDRSKFEVANIGLILFAPEINFLDSKVSTANSRISKFFGRNTFDSGRINFLKDSLRRRLINEKEHILSFEDFDKFIKTRANELLLTIPRPIKVVNPENPEKELNDLYKELIGERSVSKRKVLFPELDSKFRTQLSDRLRFDQNIPIPGYNRTIEIPYAYQNGRYNLIYPHEFGILGLDTGFRLVTEGQLINKKRIQIDGNPTEAKLIILPKIDEKVSVPADMRSSLKGLFDEFQIRSVWEEQLDEFAGEVEKQAHL